MTASEQFNVGASVKFPVNGELIPATIESLIDENDNLKKQLGFDCAVKFLDSGVEAFEYAKFSELQVEAPAEKPARKSRGKKAVTVAEPTPEEVTPEPLAELVCPETGVLFKLGDLVEYIIGGQVKQGPILELKDQKPPYTALAPASTASAKPPKSTPRRSPPAPCRPSPRNSARTSAWCSTPCVNFPMASRSASWAVA